jgi:hypothetical protein
MNMHTRRLDCVIGYGIELGAGTDALDTWVKQHLDPMLRCGLMAVEKGPHQGERRWFVFRDDCYERFYQGDILQPGFSDILKSVRSEESSCEEDRFKNFWHLIDLDKQIYCDGVIEPNFNLLPFDSRRADLVADWRIVMSYK